MLPLFACTKRMVFRKGDYGACKIPLIRFFAHADGDTLLIMGVSRDDG